MIVPRVLAEMRERDRCRLWWELDDGYALRMISTLHENGNHRTRRMWRTTRLERAQEVAAWLQENGYPRAVWHLDRLAPQRDPDSTGIEGVARAAVRSAFYGRNRV